MSTRPMSKLALSVSVAAMVMAGATTVSGTASAMPVADALAIKNAAGTDVVTVWGRGFGWGLGAGLLGGAIIGGALAAPYYYGPGPYYYRPYPYYPVYPAPGYVAAPVAPGPVASSCARYRSFDPATGTFVGRDGLRHPCA